jgi:NAD(P)H-hydrate epimerase
VSLRSFPPPRPLPPLAPDAHKGDAGRVLCVCGSAMYPGAAILVCRAAQRAGAGLVTLGCAEPELARVVPPAAPEAIYLDLSAPGALDGLADRDDDVFAAGPGLGWSERTRELVAKLVAAGERARVFDADALNVLEGRPEELRAARGPLVLTPHPGEASRLLGRRVPREEAGRIDAARELATRAGGVCVLKGHGTIVTDGERVAVNDTGNPGMATAGAGDALVGITAAYLARARHARDAGFDAFEAARAAVWVHGRAGDLAAAELGEAAVVASSLIDHLPVAQREADARREG